MYEQAALQILQHSFAELSIQDTVRKSTRMGLPPENLLISFNMIVKDVMDKLSGSYNSHRRNVVEFSGSPTIVIAKVWELIVENNDGSVELNKEHFLWALHYMKECPNFAVLCTTMKNSRRGSPCKNTVLKWVWFYVYEIRELEHRVIVWENRKTNDRGDDCLISVDATDCAFQQILINNPEKPGKKMINKALYSFKLNGPGLRYEIGLSLLSNDIVWINGPFCPGDWNDLEIFRHDLMHKLEPGERVEADNIYTSEAAFVVTPKSLTTKEEQLAMMKRVEGRHEALNKHVKNWKCIKDNYRVKGTAMEKMEKHGTLFRACAIVKQVAMQMGVGELYDV